MHKLGNRVVGLKAVNIEIVSQASDGTWILLELLCRCSWLCSESLRAFSASQRGCRDAPCLRFSLTVRTTMVIDLALRSDVDPSTNITDGLATTSTAIVNRFFC